MTTQEIQTKIFTETGIKTSVKKGSGSMKGYTIFTPMFQGGSYPKFPFVWVKALVSLFPACDRKPMFTSTDQICIYHGVEVNEPVRYKKESKPKPIEQMAVRQWGSKNSQMRYDKKVATYAKKRRGANGDNMVKYW